MEERDKDIPETSLLHSINENMRGGSYNSGEWIKVAETYLRLKMEDENR